MRRTLLEHRQGNNGSSVGKGCGAGGENAWAVAVANAAARALPAVTTAREATAVTATLVLAICEVSTGAMMIRMTTTSGMTAAPFRGLRHGLSLHRTEPTTTSRMRTTPPFLRPKHGFPRLSSMANERTATATMSTGLTMTTLRPSPTSELRAPRLPLSSSTARSSLAEGQRRLNAQ